MKTTLAGTVRLRCSVEGGMKIAVLRDVLFAPFLRRNFVSIRKLDRHGFSTVFANGLCKVVTSAGSTVAIGSLRESVGLYFLDLVAESIIKFGLNVMLCTGIGDLGIFPMHR